MVNLTMAAPEAAPQSEHDSPRPRLGPGLAGVIFLALLPVALLAAGIAVFVLGQAGASAAGGCGGG